MQTVTKNPVLAAIQMVSSDDFDENLSVAQRLINDCAEEGAGIILLPENFLCFGARHYFTLAENSETYIKAFSDLAKRLRVNLVLGSIPLNYRPDNSKIAFKVRSASIAINDLGEIIGRYDKRHLFDVDVADGQGAYRESNEFEPGRDVIMPKIDGLGVGLSICYDLRFPAHYQLLRDLGADVLMVPAAFTKVTGEAHWEALLRARAIENQCYVVAANQGGEHTPKRATWGHSMIIDPWGKVLSSLEFGEGYCLAGVDRNLISNIRRDIPVVKHRDKASMSADQTGLL